MRYAVYSETELPSYKICVLTPTILKDDIKSAYIDPFDEIDPNEVIAIDLHLTGKKTPMSEMRRYIQEELTPVLTDLQVEYLLVTDANYFKAFTKVAQVEVHLGYIVECAVGPWKVVYVPNYRQIFYDPDKVKAKIALGVSAIIQDRLGNYQAPGADIVKFVAFPNTHDEIEEWLERLIVEDRPLTCDIEGFSLKHHSAGIGTITFCWSKHEGIAFPVDYEPIPDATEPPFGKQVPNIPVRKLLKSFFERFKQKIMYHRIAYDAYVMIYVLFMQDLLDTEGLLKGMEVMLDPDRWEDTQLITYLATNSCAGNALGLKKQSQEFAGNYAIEEIKDISRVPLAELLQYNLIDGLSTWYVHEKHWDTMVADDQLDIYTNLFKPATLDIIQMQLTGMPLNMERVKEVKEILVAVEADALQIIQQSPLVQQFTYQLEEEHVAKRNAKLVNKRIKIGDEPQEFNPNSPPQLQGLLYEFLGLPVIALSDSRLPSTKGKVLDALRNYTKDAQVIDLLEALIGYKAVNKLITSFIPSFEKAAQGPDGWHYLFGNFNLGGTLSGRLSSSDPNLQNLPSNVSMKIAERLILQFGDKLKAYVKGGKLDLGKLIKSCFEAPKGWLFCGLDFASLEDRISALTTKDPNKLKVYTDGYDGHSLRAFAYFGDQMPDIRQANGSRAFKVTQDGEEHWFLEGDIVKLPDGREARIEELCHATLGKGVAADTRQ